LYVIFCFFFLCLQLDCAMSKGVEREVLVCYMRIYIFRMEEYAAFEACIMDELPITVNRFDLFPSAYAV
ncbi:hypothetical protein, partial [Neisseria meningitidis]